MSCSQKNRQPSVNWPAQIASNPLQTHSDVGEAVRQFCNPLLPHYSRGRARLQIGHEGTNYDRMRCWTESFARPLWGLAPLAAAGGGSDFWGLYREGLTNGTDPTHPEYWGPLEDNDQLSVEMPPIALSLALAPEAFWNPLCSETQARIVIWLNQINWRKIPDSNWQTFPILVNVALKRLGVNYDENILEHSLKRLEEFYIHDGWYSDGLTDRRDYYTSFAIHFALLIYANLFEKEDPLRVAIYRERAIEFADQFIYWFTANGEALPFGRSLTYRFAQGAFWGGSGFCKCRSFPLGSH